MKKKYVGAKHIRQDMKEEGEIIKAAKKMKQEDVRALKKRKK